MENKKLGQEPAFPLDGIYALDAIKSNNNGMSKRFYAACAAMQGMLSNSSIKAKLGENCDNEIIIKIAYTLADELLKQENK